MRALKIKLIIGEIIVIIYVSSKYIQFENKYKRLIDWFYLILNVYYSIFDSGKIY